MAGLGTAIFLRVFLQSNPFLIQNDARSFGQVHAAVLELAARILSQGGWRMNVIPTTESEQLDAKRPAKGNLKYYFHLPIF